MSTWRWPWTISGQTPRRVERADDRERLREAPALGGGFRPREVRRGRGHQQLWGRARAAPEGQGIEVLEVERPKRQRRSSRRKVKSDFSDPESAARAVLASETSGVPKSGDGCVEMIR